MILDFTQPGVVQVAEVVIITNTQNKMVVPSKTGAAVLNYDLPQGAANLQFQDGALGDRFIQTDKGFGDTQTIPPGSGYQLVFAYDLPYDRQAAITLYMPVPVQQVVVMLPNDGVSLSSKQLQFAGSRDVQGTSLQLFVGANLAVSSPLMVSLTGTPRATPAGVTDQPQPAGRAGGFPAGAGGFGVLVLPPAAQKRGAGQAHAQDTLGRPKGGYAAGRRDAGIAAGCGGGAGRPVP